MSKFKLTFFSIIAAGVLLSMSSVTANAQLPQKVVDSLTPKYRAQGPCSDPWVTIAIGDVFANTRAINGIGRYGDCDVQRYNNGSWGSYAELYQAVKTALHNLSTSNVTTTKSSLPDGTYKIETDAGSGFVFTQVVSHDGGTLLNQDGSGVVASGGGNVVGTAGGSVVSQGGGNVGPQRILMSTATEKRIYLGKSVLIIKKR